MTYIPRNEFLKLLAFTGAGLVLGACGSESTTEQKPPGDSAAVPPSPSNAPPTSGNVTYLEPGAAEYDAQRAGFNRRFDHKPALIAMCLNTDGVAEAVQKAIAMKLPIAVKSGGHCCEDFSGNAGGMVINLSRMNTIEWVNDHQVRIGPGMKLSELYGELLPRGRIIPAGTCASVGVGGLTLGGGFGLLTRQRGLTCDSLLEVTAVDGTGRILSSKDDPELLWACKGGGNGNFAIITELLFTTHEAPGHLISHRLKAKGLTGERSTEILRKWMELCPTLPPQCFSAFVLNHNALTILLTTTGSNTPEMENFILELNPLVDKVQTGGKIPVQEALRVFSGSNSPVYMKVSSAGFFQDFSEMEGFVPEVLAAVNETPGLIYQINTVGGEMNQASLEAGSAFAHRPAQFLAELQTYWQEPAQEKNMVSRFDPVLKMAVPDTVTRLYCNYPDRSFNDWQHRYYGGNYERLQAVKRRLDPQNLIRHRQSVVG